MAYMNILGFFGHNSYYICDDIMIGARSYFRSKHKNENFPQTRNEKPEDIPELEEN